MPQCVSEEFRRLVTFYLGSILACSPLSLLIDMLGKFHVSFVPIEEFLCIFGWDGVRKKYLITRMTSGT